MDPLSASPIATLLTAHYPHMLASGDTQMPISGGSGKGYVLRSPGMPFDYKISSVPRFVNDAQIGILNQTMLHLADLTSVPDCPYLLNSSGTHISVTATALELPKCWVLQRIPRELDIEDIWTNSPTTRGVEATARALAHLHVLGMLEDVRLATGRCLFPLHDPNVVMKRFRRAVNLQLGGGRGASPPETSLLSTLAETVDELFELEHKLGFDLHVLAHGQFDRVVLSAPALGWEQGSCLASPALDLGYALAGLAMSTDDRSRSTGSAGNGRQKPPSKDVLRKVFLRTYRLAVKSLCNQMGNLVGGFLEVVDNEELTRAYTIMAACDIASRSLEATPAEGAAALMALRRLCFN